MDRVAILNGETLDEELLAESFGRVGISHYVSRGLCKTLTTDDVDFANAVVDMPPGKAYILHNGRDMMLLADARPEIELGTDGDQHIYICYDLNEPEGERIEFEVSATQTEPALPSLRIAVIDMADQEVTPVHDLAPKSDQNAIRYKNQDIDSDGDGVVDAADTADHVAAEDVEGVVPEADHAASADRASDADTLGANADDGGVFGANVDADGHKLGGLRALDVDYEDHGWRFRATDGGAPVRLIPRIGGQVLSESAISYLPSDGYIIDDDTEVRGDLETGEEDAGDGWIFRDDSGEPVLVPKVGGNVYSDHQIAYTGDGAYELTGSIDASDRLATNGDLVVGTGSGAEGWWLSAHPDIDAARIVPRINGSNATDDAIRYRGGTYTIPAETEIDRIQINPDGDGLILRPGDGDYSEIIPIINGSAFQERRIRYRDSKWSFGGNVSVDAETFKLPRNDYDPSEAQVGDMWYRTDL